MDNRPLITLENVTVRVRDRWILEGTNWRIGHGEHWVVWGANGAGKTTLARVLSGDAPVVQGRVRRHFAKSSARCQGRRGVALVSSEQYHRLYQREQLFDELRHFSGRLGDTTMAGELLRSARKRQGGKAADDSYWSRVSEALGLSSLEEKPVQVLSSGEMRKLLIGCALAAAPCLLVLDEPFNGLDPASRAALVRLLEALTTSRTQMVLIVHRRQEIPAFFSHLLQVADGRVAWQGTMAEAEALWPSTAAAVGESRKAIVLPTASGIGGPPLIEMSGVTVRFGRHVVLDHINWTMRAGENWAIVGPNGAGKSTLLKLITGDQLQAYANEIRLFGRTKGSGESVWEIKARIGYVADELQARYQRNWTAFDVICSGFFDSVGLYRRYSDAQRDGARDWVKTLGLQALADLPMTQLSFGQQRLVLIARAMVKGPTLLILDEPCNGLDSANCRRVLHLLDAIVATGRTNLLYVSHRPDEMPACITHRLDLASGRVIATHAMRRPPYAPASDG